VHRRRTLKGVWHAGPQGLRWNKSPRTWWSSGNHLTFGRNDGHTNDGRTDMPSFYRLAKCHSIAGGARCLLSAQQPLGGARRTSNQEDLRFTGTTRTVTRKARRGPSYPQLQTHERTLRQRGVPQCRARLPRSAGIYPARSLMQCTRVACYKYFGAATWLPTRCSLPSLCTTCQLEIRWHEYIQSLTARTFASRLVRSRMYFQAANRV